MVEKLPASVSTPAPRVAPARAPRGVTARAVTIGLILAAVNSYWVVLAEMRWGIMDGSCLPLFITPVFLLSLLTATNLALWKMRSTWALSQVELLTVYIIIAIGETLAAHDLVQNLFGTLGHAYFYATPENKWATLFQGYLPSWLVVSDPRALRYFYEGGVSFLDPDLLRPFLVPLAAWGGMLLALVGVMLSMNILLRRHWTEHEKLAYPMVVLPVEMTGGRAAGAAFFNDRLMWAGFAVAALINIINGLHTLYQAVPPVPLIKLTRPTFVEYPWNHLYRFYYGIYPFAVALAFFIPSDLSFSCWFFFLMSQAELIASAMFGARGAPPQGFPYLADQSSGAFLALALGALMTTRGHLRQVWRAAWATGSTDDEARLYRQAIVAGSVCLGLLVIFFMLAGMSLWLAAAFLALFFLLSIAITRIRAEFGTPHEIYYINPQRLLVEALGAAVLGPRQLTAISVPYWFNRGYRSHPMPFQLESMKMAEQSGMNIRGLLQVLILATVWGILAAYWANLQITFREGASARCMAFKSWVGSETYTRLANWLQTSPPPQYANVTAVGVGAALFWAFRYIHFNSALPLHPAGYALATSFAMNYFWCSFLVGWLVKVIVLRYGGRSGHRHAYRVFLGVLLGDYTLGSIWGLIGPLAGIRTYKNFI